MNSFLPTITLIYLPWMDNAACAGITDNTMHPDHDDAQIERAKTICRPCTVRDQCLAFAYALKDKDGIYGGLTPEERHALRRRNGVTVHGETGYHRGCKCNKCSAAHADKGRRDRDKKKKAAS